MKTKYRIVRTLNKERGKEYIGTSKLYRDPKLCIGKSYIMNLNVDIKLTDEQIKKIEEQTRLEVDDAILSGKLDAYIKETVKSVIKSIVNEEIQAKNYRAYISNKVVQTLISEGIVNE